MACEAPSSVCPRSNTTGSTRPPSGSGSQLSDLQYANTQLDRPWVRPAAFVPVLAQHRDAVVDMSATGATGAATVADALEQIDIDGLRVVDGRVDLDASASIETPLEDVRAALVELQAATDEASRRG